MCIFNAMTKKKINVYFLKNGPLCLNEIVRVLNAYRIQDSNFVTIHF